MARRSKKSKYLQKLRGLTRVQLIIIFAILLVVGGGLVLTKPWENIPFLKKALQSVSGEPIADLARSKSVIFGPKRDNVVFLSDAQNVLITLDAPKGRVVKPTPIKLSPLENGVGVVIGSQESKSLFLIPVSLTFDLTQSSLTNSNIGSANVYLKDGSKKTSVLVARGIERDKLVVARVFKSGTYVLDLSGREQIGIAESTLTQESSNSSKIEAATALIRKNKNLTSEQKSSAQAAVDAILKKAGAPITEFASALYLQEKLKSQAGGFVKEVYAQNPQIVDTIQKICTERKSDRFEDFLELANILKELGGNIEVVALCENAAFIVASNKADRLVADRNANFEQVFDLLNRIKALLPQESALIEKLNKKAIEVANRDLRKVVDGESTIQEMEEALANVEFIDGEDESLARRVRDKLKKEAESKLKEVLAKNCVTQAELTYAKILVEKYDLLFLKNDLNSKVASETCDVVVVGPGGGVVVENGGPPAPTPKPLERFNECYEKVGPEPPFPFSFHFESDTSGREYARMCYHTSTGYSGGYIDIGFDAAPFQCEEFYSFASEQIRYEEMLSTWDAWSNALDDCLNIPRVTELIDGTTDPSNWKAWIDWAKSVGIDVRELEAWFNDPVGSGYYEPEIPPILPPEPEAEEPPLEDINSYEPELEPIE